MNIPLGWKQYIPFSVPDMGQIRGPTLCAFCEEPVYGDFYYRIEGQDVCKDCLKLHFRREVL